MRDKLFQIIVIIISVLLIIKLFDLQIINNNSSQILERASIQKVYDFPERGYIYDRNKKLIVYNEPYYDLMIIPKDIKISDSLSISNEINITSRDFLNRLNKARKYSAVKPSILISGITKNEYANIQEKLWKFSGLFIQKKSKRKYNFQTASNLFGYISEVNNYEIDTNPYYKAGEMIGRQGLEKSYEKVLRGKKGVKYFQKDKFNRIISKYKNGIYDSLMIPAKNIDVTLDIELQVYGDSLMKNKFGSIIAIEPKSGEILALVNSPGYDPSLLVGRDRSVNYNNLNLDSIGKPLFERGLQGQYPPGSTFKIINALIGLQENVIREETVFRCNGGHFYAKNAFMKCHTNLETYTDLNNAIYTSCNTYFAKTYNEIIENYETSSIGLDKWKDYVTSFGFGNFLGYDHPTGKRGFIPGSDYYNRWYKNSWGASTTISNSIGQGEVLTTPIQLANFAAIIANKGWYISPHFVKNIENDSIDKNYKKIKKTLISEKHFDPIIKGMIDVVEKGTAQNSKIKGITLAGKTGTAENFIKINGKRKQLTDHSIFIGFAPAEDPKIAICVFIENGYWGTRWAAPISSLIAEKYLKRNVERKWIENYILNGNLKEEYMKPYMYENFTINE
ncbi:MAG: penicillin-binding protein 2 [Flavobacteriaceae bacterium]|nr:penicillin-binding protein 2 [Flavobacteriaceae bacterium]MBL6684921.1 penicillin-binding protein 2 [Flavobacteriaceae bacterium]